MGGFSACLRLGREWADRWRYETTISLTNPKMYMAPLNRFGFAAVLAAVSAVAASIAFGNGPEVGKAAPPLNLSKILQAPADASADWAALRGKVIVIDFWATWCGPCRKSIPHWNELVDDFKGRQVQFLAIADENEAVVALFLKKNPIHSWVGLDGVGQSTHDRYRIEGIPATVIVNQQGVVAAVTHPALLRPKDIEEVIASGTSSLKAPSGNAAGNKPGDESFEVVPVTKPAFEISVRRSGPVPAGHGSDCWETSATSAEVTGQYASVKQAILTLFDGRETLLDCRTALPADRYDFVVRLPPGASYANREEAVAPMFRFVFGLNIRRKQAKRQVYVLTVASTNAPGLTPSGPESRGGGGEQPGGLKLGRATIGWLPAYFESWLGKPVLNETGLTNRYDICLKWKMSKLELLPYSMDRQVFALAEEPDAAKEQKLSAEQRQQLEAIRGKLPESESQKFSAEERENIKLLRAELAKPDGEQFRPEPETVLAAVREQLGLQLSLQRRSMPVLIVEKADLPK